MAKLNNWQVTATIPKLDRLALKYDDQLFITCGIDEIHEQSF